MFSGPKARCLVSQRRKCHTFYKYVSFSRLMSKGQSLLLVFSRALQFFVYCFKNVPVSLQRSTSPTYQWEGSSSFAASQPLNPTAWRWLRWSLCSTVGLRTAKTWPWKEKKGEILNNLDISICLLFLSLFQENKRQRPYSCRDKTKTPQCRVDVPKGAMNKPSCPGPPFMLTSYLTENRIYMEPAFVENLLSVS